MNINVFMGIIEDLIAEGKQLDKYTLKDIKKIYIKVYRG